MARIPESWLMRMVISQLSRLLKPAEGAGFWLEFYREELSQPGAGARIKHQLGLIAKYARFFRDSMLRSELPWTEALPVQIVTSEDDRGFSKRETAFLSSLYPNSQRLTLPKGSGHLTFLTRPDAYVGAVQKFLAGVAADSIFRDSAPVTH
jgi:pimeloyl-ACP methyl ester carboxylesterase